MPNEQYLDANGLNAVWSQMKSYVDANGGAIDIAPGILLYASVAEPIQKNHSTVMTESGFIGPLPNVNDAGYGLLTYDKKLYQVAYHISSINSDGLYTIIYDSDPLLIGPSESGGGTNFTTDNSLQMSEENVLEVTTPVQGIKTQAEFDALPESEQNKGLWVISDGESGGGSSSGGEIYSTEEVRIGTWIDGKPLYKRTIITMTSPSDTIGFLFVDYNIDTLCNVSGFVVQTEPTGTSSGLITQMFLGTYIGDSPAKYYIGRVIGKDANKEYTIKLYGLSGNSVNKTCKHATTIKYTKTTDEGPTEEVTT